MQRMPALVPITGVSLWASWPDQLHQSRGKPRDVSQNKNKNDVKRGRRHGQSHYQRSLLTHLIYIQSTIHKKNITLLIRARINAVIAIYGTSMGNELEEEALGWQAWLRHFFCAKTSPLRWQASLRRFVFATNMYFNNNTTPFAQKLRFSLIRVSFLSICVVTVTGLY